MDEEVEQLKKDLVRLGRGNANGQYVVLFGTLFDDPKVEQFYEALLGTLKAAKKRGVVDFKGQMLLKGAHDHVRGSGRVVVWWGLEEEPWFSLYVCSAADGDPNRCFPLAIY